jgi:hypothetical protein
LRFLAALRRWQELCSQEASDALDAPQGEYAIYRVFNIDGDTPEFYVLTGDLDTLLAVEPVTYRARPA